MYCPRPVRSRWCSAARIAGEREEPGAEIGERHADLDRRPARLAGDRHQSRHALRDEIESALRARPGPVWP